MKRVELRVVLLSILGVHAAIIGGTVAQTKPATPYDHVHLSVPDPPQAYAWYVDRLHGHQAEFPERVAFEPWRLKRPLPVQLLFSRVADAGPSEGSVIESIGFSFPDQQGVMKDPWGVKIQLVDDANLRGFHHVRLRVPDIDATLKWYEQSFGGRRTTFDGEQALRYDNMYVIVSRGQAAPSRGRAIDHVSWGPVDIHATVAAVKAQGGKIVADITGPNRFGHHIAYLEDPGGVYIELVQHNELLAGP
jgi:catechol 2,3-dioxygenase-like lactoylglutathione lyase family enzyme